MNTRMALFIFGLSLAAVTGKGAEPAPKLVPRPLPGFALPKLPAAAPQGTVAPLAPKTEATTAVAPVDPETNNRARIVFIHRRATLPPEFTKDLAKPDVSAKRTQSGLGQGTATQPGKIRIIPKSEVATLLAPPAQEKPSTP